MAISCYFGLTKSGKSFYVEKKLSPFKRVIIFDNVGCFNQGEIFTAPSNLTFLNIFKKFKLSRSFKIIIRPSRSSNNDLLSDATINLASALGRVFRGGGENLQLVIDEADFICSPHRQSSALKFIVNKGRHDNVDSHFIARNPSRIHTDIRANCTSIDCFKLSNALESPFLVSQFGKENCRKIQKLPQFWRFYCDETGLLQIFNEKNQLINKKEDKKGKKNDFLRDFSA